MTIRIDINDLPPSWEDSESADYRLSCFIDGEYFNYPISEGENHIGSSSLCAITLQAPSVHGRHVCVKRHGNRLFLRSLGNGKVLLHGKAVEHAAPLAVGEPFTFGSVTAVAECILPRDRQVAVAIAPDQVASLLGNHDSAMPEILTSPLNHLSDILSRKLGAETEAAGEPLLDVLDRCFAPAAALLLRRRAGDDWAALWERGHGASLLPDDPERTEQCEDFRLTAGEDEYRLLTEFADQESQPWRNAFCRLIFVLAVAARKMAASQIQTFPNPEPRSGQPIGAGPADPWRRLAGTAIRSHLNAHTGLCRSADQVLIMGETGTGKELAALSLHELWQCPGKFVAINCAAIPTELLEGELFGVAPGAATGVSARPGRFAQAQGGALFLDEISEMPLSLQSKLLRVLQEGEYYPVGGNRLERTDAKVIASSNRSEASLQSEHMRPDLYYRLSQVVLTMPPLRERVQDLAELCEYFLNNLERQFGRNVRGLSLGALERMKQHDWPGNVRELQNLLRNLYMRAPRAGLIQSAHLPESFLLRPAAPSGGTLASRVSALEREVIQQEIDRRPTVREAARILGLSEGYLYRKMKKLGVVRRSSQPL